MKCIDLTRLTSHGMPVFPGDESPEIVQTVFFEQDQIVNHQITSGVHAGTHMDGPMHMVKDGRKLCELPVEKFFGRGVLIDARGKEVLEADAFAEVNAGDAVLIMTGDAKLFGTEAYFAACRLILTEEAAHTLVEKGIHMLGMDTSSPDGSPFPVHRILLDAEIPIIENLCNLDQLIGSASFEVIALPAKYDTDSAPVRVVARIG